MKVRMATSHRPIRQTGTEVLCTVGALILPHLGEEELYDAIDLTKPWYHSDNIALAIRMPSVYRCPSFTPKSSGADVTTAYVAMLGDHTAWPRSGHRQFEDIVDGLSQTVAVLESEMYRLHWMSTADPGIEMIARQMLIVKRYCRTAHIAVTLCACSLTATRRFCPTAVTSTTFCALITIDDGQIPKKAN